MTGTPEALRATCYWCGSSLVAADGVWTDDKNSGDYCPEGRAVGAMGTSPHLPILAAHPVPDSGLDEFGNPAGMIDPVPDSALREAATDVVTRWFDWIEGEADQTLRAAMLRLRAALATLEPTLDACATHIHVAGVLPTRDRCEECGHDLRAVCHARLREARR